MTPNPKSTRNSLTTDHIRPRRTFIFAPGLNPDMFPKALATGTDIVCVELEDGVAPKDKDLARERAMALFVQSSGPPATDGTRTDGTRTDGTRTDGVERVVRINSVREQFGLADVAAVLATDTPPPVLMMPKVRTPDEVVWLDDLLTERGHGTQLQVIIETNQALEAAYEIAHCSTRINALFFGGVDMAAELRCTNTWESLLYARSRVVHAAASAGLDVIDVPYLDLEDLDAMVVAARQAKDLGFSGKGAIHPKQIEALNEVFTPTANEIARARQVIKTFEEADTGLVVIDGKLIEKPVLRDMHRIVAIAERTGV